MKMKKLIFPLLVSAQVVSAAANLSFSPLNSIYRVGECVNLQLQENLHAASRFHRVDLWVAVDMPSGGGLLYMTPLPFTPFSTTPQLFRGSLESTKRMHEVLDFEVLKGLSGTYTFYAAYVAEGKNPMTESFSVLQSDLAQVSTTLSDEAPLIPVVDCVSVLPAPLGIDATPEEGQVIVRWDDVTGASSYVVYWQASDGSRDIVSVGVSSYMHTGLTNGVTYSYEVTAVDVTGNKGVLSLKVDAIPKAGEKPPAAPIVSSVEPSDSKVVFSWQAVSGADSYIVYWQTAGGAVENLSVSDNSFTHNGLINGTNYTYWVTAVSATGLESGSSASLDAVPQPVAVVTPAPTTMSSGEVFRDTLRDGGLGPEMIVIPAGTFRMGDIQGGGRNNEQPVHSVSVNSFAMGRYEVTFDEYDRFADATGRSRPNDQGWSRGNRPVINVSWNDATAYTEWLSEQTGYQYRLPTEAEWEYAARAGTETSSEACAYANVHDNTLKTEDGFRWTHHNYSDGYARTAPVGSFAQNSFCLYETMGNVWEWTCSVHESGYGSGSEQRCEDKNSNKNRVVRGGAWHSDPDGSRAANRVRGSQDVTNTILGFRVARTL